MNPKSIQIVTAAICLCVLAGGLYLIRRSFTPPAPGPRGVASTPPTEKRTHEALDLGAVASRDDGYQAQLRTDVLAGAKAGFGQEDKADQESQGSQGSQEEKWSEEECKRFAAHLHRLQAKANGGKGSGDVQSKAEAMSWCADRDLSPAFIRCALTKDTEASLLECGDLGPVDEELDIPTLSDEEAEAATDRLRALIE